MLAKDFDKRTPISVIRDELKILKSNLPTQNIILSPLIRNIPTDISGFFADAALGYIASITSSSVADLNIPVNLENGFLNGTTFRIVNVGNFTININLGYSGGSCPDNQKANFKIEKGESATLVFYLSVPCWINIPGLANFINFIG